MEVRRSFKWRKMRGDDCCAKTESLPPAVSIVVSLGIPGSEALGSFRLCWESSVFAG